MANITLNSKESNRRSAPAVSVGRTTKSGVYMLRIDTDGRVVNGGPETIPSGVNEFKLFKAVPSGEDAAMAYSIGVLPSSGPIRFFGLYVLHINTHGSTVEVAVVTI